MSVPEPPASLAELLDAILNVTSCDLPGAAAAAVVGFGSAAEPEGGEASGRKQTREHTRDLFFLRGKNTHDLGRQLHY